MYEELEEKVMVNGRCHLPHSNLTVTIRRGMIIITNEGINAGFCAGVIVKQGEEKASFVLLGRLPVTSEYRQIPINLIDHIDVETIHLNVDCTAILKLPLHQPA